MAGLDGARREPGPGGRRQGRRARTAARWHLVGPLQANKARRAIEAVDVIQSVDSLELARRLDRIAGEVRPGDAVPGPAPGQRRRRSRQGGLRARRRSRPRIAELLALPNLRVDGLMTIGRLVDRPRRRPGRRSSRCASCATGSGAADPSLGTALSMGMTDDFEVAVEEGATIVRVGRALFGERPSQAPDRGRSATAGRLGAMGALVQATIGGIALVLWLLIFARLLLSWVDPMGRMSAVGLPRLDDGMAPGADPPDAPADGHLRLLRPARAARARRRDARLPLEVVLSPADVRFAVRLTPRGGSDHVDGVARRGAARSGVGTGGRRSGEPGAPPTSRRRARLPRRDVRLVAGAASRTKLVVIDDIDPERVLERWPDLRI